MNNFPNLYFDYVGSTGEHTITDFIIESSNNNFLYTSNSSNIIENDILITSNILENHSINYTSNLKYNISRLINEEIEHITIPVSFDKKHTYIYNSNLLGEIRFYCESSKDFPVIVPVGVPDYRIKIDVDGKLKVYYTYDPAINLTFGNGWIDVANTLVALNASDANIGLSLAGLGATITANYAYFEQKIDNLLFGLRGLGILNDANVLQLQQRFSKFRYETFPFNSSVANIYSEIREFLRTGITNYLQRAVDNITIRITQNSASAFFLGIGGIAFAGATSAIQNMNYLDIISSILNSNITSNSNITEIRRIELLSSNTDEYISTAMDYCSNMYNFSIAQGFINSNIITQQYIPLLNVNEIKINQTNISNIISSSSNINYIYSSNNSNLLFNNIGISSNNNYIYSSNSIDKINILLPNSSFWYDANFGGIWCYDLNIEKYVKASILPNNYKYRSFRITTYQSKADWKNGYNLYGAGIAGEYINFPETLTIHMNNNKQIGGISTADDTYSNGIILGKTKNTNIGYWNILKDNFNYIRYLTKVGWDLVCVIEIL